MDIVGFLEGKTPDHRGRTFSMVLAFSDDRAEQTHEEWLADKRKGIPLQMTNEDKKDLLEKWQVLGLSQHLPFFKQIFFILICHL